MRPKRDKRSIIFCLMAILVFGGGISGCGKKESVSLTSLLPSPTPADYVPPTPTSAPRPQVTASPAPPKPIISSLVETPVTLEAENFVQNETAIQFDLRHRTDRPITTKIATMMLVAPSLEELNLSVTEATLGGQPVSVPDGGIAVRAVGFLRRWPIIALDLKKDALEELRSESAQDPQDFTANISISWSKPPQIGDLPSEPVWRNLAAMLVANDEALDQYALRDLNHTTTPETLLTHPGNIATGAWAASELEVEGLYEVDHDQLASLEGFSDPGYGLYSGGKSVSQAVVGEGSEARHFFWMPENPSKYTKNRTFFVGANTKPQLFAQSAFRAAEDLPVLDEPTRRVVSWGDQNELVINYGAFRAIRDLRWVDRQISPTPTTVTVPIPSNLGSGKSHVEMEFYFGLRPEAPVDLKAEGIALILETRGATRKLTFDAIDATKRNLTFELPEILNADGTAAEFTLRLEAPLTSPYIFDVWLQSIDVNYPASRQMVDGELVLEFESKPAENSDAWVVPFSAPGVALENLLALRFDSNGIPSERVPIIARADHAGVLWPGSVDQGHVKVFDIGAVPKVTNFRPSTTDNLTSPENSADYLIIAHSDFIETLQPLVEHRAATQGVRVVDVQAIYDSFSHGELTPDAIRRFLSHTLTTWKKAPERVLLVGDCTSDYRNYAKWDVRNFVPTKMLGEGPDEWASDEWMGLVAGNDALPDFQIGRLSVNNTDDLQAIIEKIRLYDAKPEYGPWRARNLWVADNEVDFVDTLERLEDAIIPDTIETHRIYASERAVIDNFYADDARRRATFETQNRWMKISTEATQMLLAQWRAGAALLSYCGHGSPNIWADERIWFGGDSENSDNLHTRGIAPRLPVVFNYTCKTGAVDYPKPPWNITIIEDMMRMPLGGAIASISPSGPGLWQVQEVLGTEFYRAILHEHVPDLGTAITLAKARFASHVSPSHFIDYHRVEYNKMYILQGDPALTLQTLGQNHKFTFPDPLIPSGGRIAMELVSEGPDSGEYIVQVEAPDGRILLTSAPEEFSDARIAIGFNLPQELELGPKILRVFAWHPEKGEFATAGHFEIHVPEVDLVSAGLKLNSEGRTEFEIELLNSGLLPALPRLVISGYEDDGTTTRLFRGDVVLNPDQRMQLNIVPALEERVEGDVEAYDVFEVSLTRLLPASDLTQALIQSIRLARDGKRVPAYVGAELRIVPESITTDPESPSEGRTIWVEFEVENVGDKTSRPSRVTLYDGNPDQQGKPVYDHNKFELRIEPSEVVDALGPGRRTTMRLRWDPVFNAGEQEFWIRIEQSTEDGRMDPENLTARGTVQVRSGHKLVHNNLRGSRHTLPDGGRALRLTAEVTNEGETPARDVVVAFFKTKEQTDANKIFEQSLDLVEPGAVIPIEYIHPIRSLDDYPVDENQRPDFTVQMWLKGSRVRLAPQ